MRKSASNSLEMHLSAFMKHVHDKTRELAASPPPAQIYSFN